MSKIIDKYIKSDTIPVEGKLFNVIVGCGAIGSFVASIINLFNSTTKVGAMYILLLSVILVCLLIYTNKEQRYESASMMVCIGICCVLYPFIFFKSGGFISGMPCWFILGIFVIFTMVKGIRLIISVSLAFVVQIGCVVIERLHPEYVASYEAFSHAMYMDIVYSYVVVAFVIGMTMRIQLKIYAKEKKLAEDASKAKADFLANMSHEIRTPINAVLGLNEMIMRDSTEEQIQEYAMGIESAGNNLLSIINDVLDFSKIESGKVEILPVRYKVNTTINELYNLTFTRAEAKNIKFKVKSNPDIPSMLFGDEVRICQIVSNILSNAIKYTEEGSVTLSVDYEKLGPEQVDLIYEVADSGVGIKEKDIDKIFNEFQRVDEKKNRSIEGTGLGLSITKSLVEIMRGSISVESEYGKGSTFTVKLPQKIISAEPIGEFQFNHERSEKNVNDKRIVIAPSARILTVDDNIVNLMVLEKLLGRTRAIIDKVSSGQECIEKVKENHYDIIFLDHMMPELDGIETLKIMKAEGLIDKTPVISLTANAIVGAREMYISEGFQDYLSKPVSGDALDRVLSHWLPEELVGYTENLKS